MAADRQERADVAGSAPSVTRPMRADDVGAASAIARPMRADARRNRERLVAVACEVFAEHGVNASLDEIARRSGVGPGTLYRHFPTRESLLAAVYRDDMDGIAAEADELADRLPPEAALDSWLRGQLGFVAYKRGLGAAIKAVLGDDSETLKACRATIYAAAGRLVARAQEAGAVRADVRAGDVLRLVHAVGVASETAPEDAERLLSIVLDGLRPAR